MNSNFDNIDKQKLINSVIASSGGKIDNAAINSAKQGDMSGLISALSVEDKKKLNAALQSGSLNKILASDDAKALMSKFFGGGK
ncbi:MAG: hypothetical protein IJZ75_04725 [Clostridia bacterium]|nr:hypothetical protein [Clostridia bacterium]